MGQLLQRPSTGSAGGIAAIPGIFRQNTGIVNFPNGAFTQVTFDTVVLDSGSPSLWHAGATFSVLTVPVTGIYQINGSVIWPGFNATNVELLLGKTASIFNAGASQGPNVVANGISNALSGVLSLVTGDTIALWAFQNSGGTPSGVLANMSVFRIA